MALSRRRILQAAAIATIGHTATAAAAQNVRPKVLLRSSWQTVNIGDVGHTPGILSLLGRLLPEVDVWLWPSDVRNGVSEMLLRRFPNLRIVTTAAAITAAIQQCDFLLHGSGPSLVGSSSIDRWKNETGKPYGVFGITVSSVDDRTFTLLSGAAFVFFRDTISFQLAQRVGMSSPVRAFGPDGAFAVDLQNDVAATGFLQKHGLQEKEFLCCIPRLRYTPYWLFKTNFSFDPVKHARNEEMKEHDHAPLRQAIVEVVRNTTKKMLICPEDVTQMAVGREMILDKLPEDVASRVVLRDTFWLTDEAVSVYRRSAGVFGLDLHSPIMAIGNGIPAIACRFEEQTSKTAMWRDIGLGDWLFDMDTPADVARISSTVLSIANDTAAATAKAMAARQFVGTRQRIMVATLRTALFGPKNTGATPPIIGNIAAAVTCFRAGNPVAFAPRATIVDVDSSSLDQHKLIVAVTSNPQPSNRIELSGATFGLLNDKVMYRGVTLGTLVPGSGLGNTPFEILLTANASPRLVETLLRLLRFRLIDSPSVEARELTIRIVDRNGVESNRVPVGINVR